MTHHGCRCVLVKTTNQQLADRMLILDRQRREAISAGDFNKAWFIEMRIEQEAELLK